MNIRCPPLMSARSLVCVLLCVGLLSAAPAAADGYRVELLVFERLDPEPDEELLEHLAAFPVAPPGAILPWVAEESAVTTPVTPLSETEAFPAEYNSLRRAAGYRPLLRLAWLQPAWKRAPSLWLPQMVCPPLSPGGEPRQALGGAVRVEDTGRLYLHLDLAVRGCMPEAAPIMRFAARMRILLKKIYHIDHPRLGGLVRVQRYIPASHQ